MARDYKAPVFQHRQYAEIADAFARERATTSDPIALKALRDLEVRLIGKFQCDNGKFDVSRYVAAATGSPKGKDKR